MALLSQQKVEAHIVIRTAFSTVEVVSMPVSVLLAYRGPPGTHMGQKRHIFFTVGVRGTRTGYLSLGVIRWWLEVAVKVFSPSPIERLYMIIMLKATSAPEVSVFC